MNTAKTANLTATVEMSMTEVHEIRKAAGIPFRVGMTKAEVVRLVNAQNQKEEVEMKAQANVKVPEGMTKEQYEKNMKMLEKMSGDKLELPSGSADKHDHFAEIRETRLHAAQGYMDRIGEHKVKVLDISPLVDNHNQVLVDARGRIGEITIQVEPGVMETKIWHKDEKKFHDYDMCDLNFNAFAYRPDAFQLPYEGTGLKNNLQTGSGIIKLEIMESKFDHKVWVRMPADKGNDGKWHDVFKVADSAKYTTAATNNKRLQASLTAMVQFFFEQFEYTNPMNRHRIDINCEKCPRSHFLTSRDGVEDAGLNDRKSRAVFNNSDGEAQMDNRQFEESLYCEVFDFFVDTEAVALANEAVARQNELIIDLDGEMDWVKKGELEIGGRKMLTNEFRGILTEDTAKNCQYMAQREYKNTKRMSKEFLSNGGQFVMPFVESYVYAGSQLIQSEAKGPKDSTFVWKNGAPSEVEGEVRNVRIKGIGGLSIEPAENVLNSMDFSFAPETEEYDAETADFMKKINWIYFAAFNRERTTEAQYKAVKEMAKKGKPADLNTYQSQRWDTAVSWLDKTEKDAEDREERMSQPDYTTHFFPSIEAVIADEKQPGTELHLEDVIFEHIFKVRNGIPEETMGAFDFDTLVQGRDEVGKGVPFDSGKLNPDEFVRNLDDSAYDYVYEVIMTGEMFHLTGGTEEDHELVAGALQSLLNSQVRRIANSIAYLSDDAKLEEFMKLKACDSVLEYVARYAGLLDNEQ